MSFFSCREVGLRLKYFHLHWCVFSKLMFIFIIVPCVFHKIFNRRSSWYSWTARAPPRPPELSSSVPPTGIYPMYAFCLYCCNFNVLLPDEIYCCLCNLVEISEVLAIPDKNLFESFYNIDPRSWTKRFDVALWSAFTSPYRTRIVEGSYWPCCWVIASMMWMGRPWRSWSPAPKGSQVDDVLSVLLFCCVDVLKVELLIFYRSCSPFLFPEFNRFMFV